MFTMYPNLRTAQFLPKRDRHSYYKPYLVKFMRVKCRLSLTLLLLKKHDLIYNLKYI